MHKSWPEGEEAIALPAKELALRLLDRLATTTDDPLHSLLRRDSFIEREVAEYESRRRRRPGATTVTRSDDALALHPDIAHAWGEAWDHAVREGWIGDDPTRRGFVRVTRGGQERLGQYRSEEDLPVTASTAPTEAAQQQESDRHPLTKIDVLRFLAQVHADPQRRYLLRGGGDLAREAVKIGLLSSGEHGTQDLARAMEQLASEEAVSYVDAYPEPRREGEALSGNRFYNCRDIDITLRGHEVISNLNLLGPEQPPKSAVTEVAPALPRPRRAKKFRHSRGEQFGRFRLAGQLGAGGNGEVWEAVDKDTGEIVAVKILHPDNAEQLARFRREVETVSELAAELAVLPIIDFEFPRKRDPWYATPVAINLRQATSKRPLGERVSAVRDLAHVLAELTQRGIHHRDVKPENLYFHCGRYLLGDFGLVKRPDDEALTRVEHVPGPYEYLPNEAVIRWDEADFAAIDLFCLAKTLWVIALDEKRPPRGRVAAGDVYSLSRRLPDEAYIDELDRLIDRATADDPAARGSLSQFAADLDAWLTDRDQRPRVRDDAEREGEIDDHVRRWAVDFSRNDPTFGRSLIHLTPPDGDSPVRGVPNGELASSLVRLRDNDVLMGEGDPLSPRRPAWWSGLYTLAYVADEIEGRSAMEADATPLLRALKREPQDVISLNAEQSEVEIAGLRYAPAAAYFLLRYCEEHEYLDYRESSEAGGVLLLEPRVTSDGGRLAAGASLPPTRASTSGSTRAALASTESPPNA